MTITNQIEQIQKMLANIASLTTPQLIMNGKIYGKLLAYIFNHFPNSDQHGNNKALELNKKIKEIESRNRREIKRPINYVEQGINKRNKLSEGYNYNHEMGIQTNLQNIIEGVKSAKNQYFQAQLHNFNIDALKQHQNQPDQDAKINSFFQSITHRSIPLQHPESAALSSVLYRNTFISTPRTLYSQTLGLPYKQLWNIKNLRQYACCLANKGGGYIIIGVNQIDKNKVEGFEAEKFNPFEYQQFLKKIQNCIRPPIEISCGHIPVFIDYPKSNTDAYSTNLICLKLVIRTLYHGYLHYIQMKTKGYHDLFEIYYLKPRSIIQELNKSEIYGQMVAMFEQRNSKKQKGYDFSEKVYETPLKFLTTEIQTTETNAEESEIFETEKALYEPKFQYKENSFIIVGSQKKNKFIEKFRLLIQEKKIPFSLMRPFEKYLIKGGRVIWFFSYNYKYQHMREVIKNCDKGKNFTFTPITKTIRIPKKKVMDSSFQSFKEEFNHLYPNAKIQIIEGKYEGLDKSQIDCYFISFPDFTTAVWGFCLFQGMSLKPYCITNKAKQGYEKGKLDQDHHYIQQSKGDFLHKI